MYRLAVWLICVAQNTDKPELRNEALLVKDHRSAVAFLQNNCRIREERQENQTALADWLGFDYLG